MKRWTFRIVLMLLLGVVTTVAVAWGFVYFAELEANQGQSARSNIEGTEWHVLRTEMRGYVHVRSVRCVQASTMPSSRSDPDELAGWTGFETPLSDGYEMRYAYGYGLPVSGLWWELRWVDGSRLVVGGISSGEKYLPLRPIWPGFLIDTVFYGVIWFGLWFGLFFGFSAARRRVRRRRGRCVKCGYDLRGQRSAVSDQKSVVTQGCPECGWGREGADL